MNTEQIQQLIEMAGAAGDGAFWLIILWFGYKSLIAAWIITALCWAMYFMVNAVSANSSAIRTANVIAELCDDVKLPIHWSREWVSINKKVRELVDKEKEEH